jgi:hypothetical protein
MKQYKEPTENMKAALLDLLHVVNTYDEGQAGLFHDVRGVHHATLKAMAKKTYGCLIILEASNSPTGIVWAVAITRYGLKIAKQLSKTKSGINATANKSTRNRITINWQVDMTKADGRQVYEDAKAMKRDKKQSFTRTMNQLIQLHKELKAGQVGLLQTLYPEAYSTMLLIAQNEIEMEREDRLGELIGEWKRLMLSQGANLPHSSFRDRDNSRDDETNALLTVKKDEGAGLRSSQNFINSLMALNPIPTANGNPRQLNVPQFAVPDYEDENLFG